MKLLREYEVNLFYEAEVLEWMRLHELPVADLLSACCMNPGDDKNVYLIRTAEGFGWYPHLLPDGNMEYCVGYNAMAVREYC